MTRSRILSDQERAERRKQTHAKYYEKVKERDKQKRKDSFAKWYQTVKDDPEFKKRNKQRLANSPQLQAAQRARNRAALGAVNPSGESPSGPCEICGTPTEGLHYDHDHDTGAFRGWLCRNCNTGLGMFKDDASVLQSAIAYLTLHKVSNP